MTSAWERAQPIIDRWALDLQLRYNWAKAVEQASAQLNNAELWSNPSEWQLRQLQRLQRQVYLGGAQLTWRVIARQEESELIDLNPSERPNPAWIRPGYAPLHLEEVRRIISGEQGKTDRQQRVHFMSCILEVAWLTSLSSEIDRDLNLEATVTNMIAPVHQEVLNLARITAPSGTKHRA